MSLKDLFSNKSQNVISTENLTLTGSLIESYDQIKAIESTKNRYISNVDFSLPSNFARFGSAELYYKDSLKNIYLSYPYDGSDTDKKNWKLGLTDLELYLFDSVYPKTTGYIKTGYYGSYVGLYTSGSNTISTNSSVAANFDDLLKTKVLSIDPDQGYTIEFWAKFDNLNNNISKRPAIYAISGSNGIEKLQLYSTVNLYGLKPNNAGFPANLLFNTSSINLLNWNHFAISVINSGSSTNHKFYVNGQLNSQISNSKFISGSNVIKYLTIGTDTGGSQAYAGFSGSVDEFRLWNKERTAEEIGRNWFTTINSNIDLALYYKFNEGIINSSSLDANDALIVDYSGNNRNALFYNYRLGLRNTGSAVNESGLVSTTVEQQDPIIRSSNQLVQDTISAYSLSGSDYDATNNNSIYKSIPSWIIEEEEDAYSPNIKYLTQIISSYFDDLYNKTIDISQIHNKNYAQSTGSVSPFYGKLLDSKGFVAPDLFINADVIEQLLSRTNQDIFDEDISKIKNLIYQNIYNNLLYIYKSKGTQKSIQALLNSYGVDENLVKINVYSDDGEYTLNDTFVETAIKKKQIDFRQNNFSSTVYQKFNSINAASLSYIPSVLSTVPFDLSYLTPLTFEGEFIFPKDLNVGSNGYIKNYEYSSSLFGAHTANTSNQNDLAWYGSDIFNYQVYAVKKDIDSTNGYFLVNYKFGNTEGTITSSYINDLYENSKWNLSTRIKPNIDSYLGELSYGSDDYFLSGGLSYTFDLYAVNSISSETVQIVSSSVLFAGTADVTASMQSGKRIYIGAHYNNFTGSLLSYSDSKAVSMKVWLDYLQNDELEFHAKILNNYGRKDPFSRIEEGINSSRKYESNILNWTFENVTGSDGSGNFYIEDAATTISPSSDQYRGITDKYYYGYGDKFANNSIEFIKKDYIATTKQNMPEAIHGSDMVKISSDTDIVFNATRAPNKYYISIENNMYQIISEEILNMFSGIVSFNDLIGDLKNKYSDEYGDLNLLKEIFFKKINNTPNLEKYLEFYKWLDSSLGMMIEQLIPSTARFTKGLSNIVESHILERNKYGYKKPLISTTYINVNQPIRGIEQLKTSWNSSLAIDKDKEHIARSRDKKDKTYTITSEQEISGSSIIKLVNTTNIKLSDSAITGSVLAGSEQIINPPIKNIGNYRFVYDMVQTTGRLSKNKNIFVNKFESASGSILNLDTSTIDLLENYSQYGILNFKNYNIRKYYNIALSQTASSLYQTSASKHRTNKNTFKKFIYANPTTTSSYVLSYNYDNALIQHQIPRSDTQYAWIKASLAQSPSASIFTNQYPNLNTNLIFVTASLLSSSGQQLSQSGNWKLLANNRDGYKSRYLSKNNIIEYVSNNGAVTSAVEPPVEWNFPVRHILNVEDASRDVEIYSSFNNLKDDLTNPTLKDAIVLFNKTDDTVYEQVKKIESDGISNLKIKEVEFKEYILPRKNKVGLFDIRYRELDSETYGTSSLGKNPSYITKFWDSNINSRVRNALSTSSGWTKYDYYDLLNYRYNLISNSAGEYIESYPVGNAFKYVARNNNRLASYNLMDNEINVDTTFNGIAGSIVTCSITVESSIKGELSDFDMFEKRNMVISQSLTNALNTVGGYNYYYSQYVGNGPYRVKPRAFVNNTMNYDYAGKAYNFYYSIYNAGYKYVTDKISGKKPAYDSYYEFSNDLKPISKNYSLLPEYKIENYMEEFIKNNLNYNITGNYLSLEGRDQDYSYYNDLNFVNKINNINLFTDKVNKIKFKVNAIKKLLPYNGFYPLQRAAQIVTQFQKAFFELNDNIITGSNVTNVSSEGTYSPTSYGSKTPLDQEIQTILQPFFAPGILFNSFKAGISMPFPVYTGSPTSTSTDFPFYVAGVTGSANPLQSLYADWNTGASTARKNSSFYFLNSPTEIYKFTDILDPFSRIFNNHITTPTAIYYMAPDAYSESLIAIDNACSYPSFIKKPLDRDPFSISKKSNIYYLSINNYLSEIPNFFLENKKLTTFVSSPEDQFKAFTSGTTYYMDIILKRDDGIKSSLDVNFQIAYYTVASSSLMAEGAAYGYAYDTNNSDIGDAFSEYGYAPVAPPYIHGNAIARISFTPNDTRNYSLREIQNLCKIENINTDLYSQMLSTKNDPKSSAAYISRVKLENCFDLFGKTKINNLSYDQYGNPTDIRDNNNSAWTIQPYFECPILNFETPENRQYATSSIIDSSGSFHKAYKLTSVGLWTGYGEIPKNNGVNVSIRESYQDASANTGSLVDQCGFGVETKTLGLIARNKEISEGIVILPYNTKDINKISNIVDNFDFFKVNKSTIDKLLGVKFNSITNVDQLRKILDNPNIDQNNSIIKTMKCMIDYSIPYHLDWIRNRAIDPFVIYILEIKHTLDQQDLSDIWQGLLPKIGTTAELDDYTIEHNLSENEFFHNQKIPSDIKFKTFKVKKRANINYFDLTATSKDDNRFVFKFDNKAKPQNSYNWPYDHFSLAELVNIEASFIYSSGSV